MKRCSKCAQIYSDDSYSFCLHDGAGLVLTDRVGQMDSESILTVVRATGHSDSFTGRHTNEMVSYDDLQLKLLSDDGEHVRFGMKIAVRNLARSKQNVYVTVHGLDVDGFQVEEYCFSTNVAPAETVTYQGELSCDEWRTVAEWRLDEVVGHE